MSNGFVGFARRWGASLIIGFLMLGGAPAGAAAPEKDWTFLVYMNGNNNLDTWGGENIREMERVGSTDRVNVVVQWASLERRTVQRLLVTPSTNPDAVTSPILEDLGAQDMGDYRTLIHFIQWGVRNFPAKHYFIDVWDHGTGWHGEKLHAKDISHDEVTGHWITTPQLSWAMAEAAKAIGHKIDLYGSDACEMGMVEIATELADSVQYFVGSEEDIPLRGWPYAEFLAKWAAAPALTAPGIAALLTGEYAASFSGGSHGKDSVTLSAFDLSQTDALLGAIAGLGKGFPTLDVAAKARVNEARIQALSITTDYLDLLDFVDEVDRQGALAAVGAEAVSRLREAASRYVIASSATGAFDRARGISIWFPAYHLAYDTYAPTYRALRFSRATRWDADVKGFLLD